MADGKGLCLEVTPAGSKLWRYRYLHADKPTMVSFGAWPEISLAQARQRHVKACAVLRSGITPAAKRQAVKSKAVHAAANTFGAVALEWSGKQQAGMAPPPLPRGRRACTWLHHDKLRKRTILPSQPSLIPAAFSMRPIRDIGPVDVLLAKSILERAARSQRATAFRPLLQRWRQRARRRSGDGLVVVENNHDWRSGSRSPRAESYFRAAGEAVPSTVLPFI